MNNQSVSFISEFGRILRGKAMGTFLPIFQLSFKTGRVQLSDDIMICAA